MQHTSSETLKRHALRVPRRAEEGAGLSQETTKWQSYNVAQQESGHGLDAARRRGGGGGGSTRGGGQAQEEGGKESCAELFSLSVLGSLLTTRGNGLFMAAMPLFRAATSPFVVAVLLFMAEEEPFIAAVQSEIRRDRKSVV